MTGCDRPRPLSNAQAAAEDREFLAGCALLVIYCLSALGITVGLVALVLALVTGII